MLERRPWLPFAAFFLVALLASLVTAYERDWWVFSKPPHVPPARPHQTLTHEEFWEQADREYYERLKPRR